MKEKLKNASCNSPIRYSVAVKGKQYEFMFADSGLTIESSDRVILEPIRVYLFTVLLPTLLIHLYRKYQGWTLHELGMKERRMVPYIISIVCYFACYYIMNLYHIPHFISSILITALAIQIICALINVWWKISTHSAAIGGVTGALMSFALLFHFNPTWWLCLAILFAGLVGSSRIILKQHTLSQVNVGFIVGLISAFYIISMI